MSSQLPTTELLIQRGRDRLSELSHSLNDCFQLAVSLEIGAAEPWEAAHRAMLPLGTAGLFLVFRLSDEQSFLLAIPETLPLPGWYRNPDSLQQQALQNLVQIWAGAWLPEEFSLGEHCTVQAHDLATAISWSSPLPNAQVVELSLQADSVAALLGSGGEIDHGQSLWLIGPVETPPSAHVADDAYQEDDYENSQPGAYDSYDDYPASNPPYIPVDTGPLIERIRRLLPLNTTVSVRLAEMKIELSSLVNLCPGTLLVFPKSCDDLLDLYVNNQLYAQGEAVKIGEKFGLKINHVGVKKQRKSGVFSL